MSDLVIAIKGGSRDFVLDSRLPPYRVASNICVFDIIRDNGLRVYWGILDNGMFAENTFLWDTKHNNVI